MSSKKNNFNSKERYYMRLAINLARDRVGLTKTNPSVGCVIVKNDQIISVGQTSYNGRPHAEYNAIKNCKEDLKDSTIFVSLEPCSHYGQTPPCTNEIIKSKIKKIITTDTIDNSKKIGRSRKIEIISIAPIISEAMKRIANSTSVSSLFK